MTYAEWKEMQGEAAEETDKPLKNNDESGIINTEEMLREKVRHTGESVQTDSKLLTFRRITSLPRSLGQTAE